MDERQLEGALDRLDRALGKAEAAAASRREMAVAAANQAERLAALETRHAELKQAVASGLRQLDEMLAGMGQ